MSYRIEYASGSRMIPGKSRKYCRIPWLTGAFLVLFVLLVHGFWPEGREVLWHLFIGEEGVSMAECVAAIARSVEEGRPLYDAAVTAFREVIHGY